MQNTDKTQINGTIIFINILKIYTKKTYDTELLDYSE